MREASDIDFNNKVYLRLIALWVVCEAFAGGILHGFKIPFTGLGVSSLSVFCIIMIGYFFPEKGSILKATIIVAIFKLMLSPHAPPTAYIALFFQGLLGQIIVNKKHFTTGAVILGVAALVESAIQRIFVLMLLYGNTFWKAVDEFVKKTISVKQVSNFSFKLAISYIIIHAVAGLFAGKYSARTANKISTLKKEDYLFPEGTSILSKPENKIKINKLLIFIWIFLIVIYFQQYFSFGFFVIGRESVLNIVLRFFIILLTWFVIVSPLIKIFIRSRLQKASSKYDKEIIAVMQILPEVKYIVAESWKRSSERKHKRYTLFMKYVMVNILFR